MPERGGDGLDVVAPVSVIATLLNEIASVDALVASVLGQVPGPAEFVIVDAGSTDGTRARLAELAAADARVRVIDAAVGRSAGRNTAIAAAEHEVIACTDGGCTADAGWLAALTGPFADGATFVAGFYRPEGATPRSTAIGAVMVYVDGEVDPDTFLPSGRSVAFRRDVWAEVGGFPEDLQFAEDTLFDERVIAAGHRPVFAGDAVVAWRPPATYRQLARTLHAWGRGDGLAGLRGPTYRRLAVVVGAAVVGPPVLGAFSPWAAPVALLPLAAATARTVRSKWSAVPAAARVHLPVAAVVHTVAVLTGFVRGRRERRAGGAA